MFFSISFIQAIDFKIHLRNVHYNFLISLSYDLTFFEVSIFFNNFLFNLLSKLIPKM